MGLLSAGLANFLAHQYQATREGGDLNVRPATRPMALLAITLDLVFFVLGILCFSLAVLLNMF